MCWYNCQAVAWEVVQSLQSLQGQAAADCAFRRRNAASCHSVLTVYLRRPTSGRGCLSILALQQHHQPPVANRNPLPIYRPPRHARVKSAECRHLQYRNHRSRLPQSARCRATATVICQHTKRRRLLMALGHTLAMCRVRQHSKGTRPSYTRQQYLPHKCSPRPRLCPRTTDAQSGIVGLGLARTHHHCCRYQRRSLSTHRRATMPQLHH